MGQAIPTWPQTEVLQEAEPVKTLVFHSAFFVSLGLLLWPMSVVHSSPSTSDSVHFCQLIDFEQWQRNHLGPAGKLTLLR